MDLPHPGGPNSRRLGRRGAESNDLIRAARCSCPTKAAKSSGRRLSGRGWETDMWNTLQKRSSYGGSQSKRFLLQCKDAFFPQKNTSRWRPHQCRPNAMRAALSQRNILDPRVSAVNPASRRSVTSRAERPPSGPTTQTVSPGRERSSSARKA